MFLTRVFQCLCDNFFNHVTFFSFEVFVPVMVFLIFVMVHGVNDEENHCGNFTVSFVSGKPSCYAWTSQTRSVIKSSDFALPL